MIFDHTLTHRRAIFVGKIYFKQPLTLTLFLSLTLIFSFPVLGANRRPMKPLPRDKCPVCGMFVSKYPDWLAAIVFKDGSYAVFDGVKDMMKYYHNLKKYNPSKRLTDIDFIQVNDYYRLAPIDGSKAYYVIGSNIYGPMGKELIPFEKKEDAEEFMVDHVGKALLKFQEITPEVLKGLD
ncbi:MAG: nitrous oxide reductase accessory protein NosL [Treponemataceae bacterium]|nr:nitrous oxide reductase accessory protein NosL [Treponemataceae bacterium]